MFQVIDPFSTVLINTTCNLERSTIGCFFSVLLTNEGAHTVSITIDDIVSIANNVQLQVVPGMVSGPLSTLAMLNMSQLVLAQIFAGDMVVALLTLRDIYGNNGTTSYGFQGWNTSAKVMLISDQGIVVDMTISSGVGIVNATAIVTSVGLYVVSAFLGSSQNNLQGSGKFMFEVIPNTNSSAGTMFYIPNSSKLGKNEYY